ncbi:hypothetical protein EON77_09295, partial [bacterium]
VAEAAVVLREDSPGDHRLVGYVRTADGSEADVATIRAAMARRLPDYMIPSQVVTLAALPTTPNGKLDRRAMPAPASVGSLGSAPAAVAPVTAPAAGATAPDDLEALIVGIWQKALGHTRFGTQDNFFDIGGHSLLVIQVLRDLREALQRPIQLTDLFRHTTIDALASFLGGGAATESKAPSRGQSRADARRAARGNRG